jgi:uracil-DNA glycosylase family 4
VVVGESPGREEVLHGRPFVGPTGQQLNEELLSVGLRRSRLFILNAVLCQPPMGKAKKTLGQAVKCCSKVFEWQLRHYDTDIPTFAMGEAAALAILQRKLPKGGISKARGFVRDLHLPRRYTSKGKTVWREEATKSSEVSKRPEPSKQKAKPRPSSGQSSSGSPVKAGAKSPGVPASATRKSPKR